MRICGIDYQGSDLIPVVVEQRPEGWRMLPTKPKKIKIADIYDTDEVRLFAKQITAFLTDAAVARVVIKKRAKSGKYGGGAASFRMGGIVQLSTEKPVDFMSPNGVSAALRDEEYEDPHDILTYQRDAFRTALAYALSQ